MGIRDTVNGWLGRRPVAAAMAADLAGAVDLPLHGSPWPAPPAPVLQGEVVLDLPERRQAAQEAVATRKAEALVVPSGLMMDQDDYQYRRLSSSGNALKRRDLTPIMQDRMLEMSWYLWESNPFAKRLITLMTDLIIGDGWTVEADDPRIQEVIDRTWNSRTNKLATRTAEFHNSLSLNGELILPAAVNPVDGRVRLGFLDPAQILDVEKAPDNVLEDVNLVLKPANGVAGPGQKLAIIRENQETGFLEGEVFYFPVNKLPNSGRGRGDLLSLADWLDLYDQYLFAEVERINMLSSFVWDYQIDGADGDMIQAKLKALPTPRAGAVFGHNEKEKLEARTPDLKAADRSEAGRMLRTHIAGSFGFPLSYLGEIDSNRATIEGQNDVLLKTPSARQKLFAGFMDQVIKFTVQEATRKNPALFRDAKTGYRIRMPEVATKDVARAGTVLASVVAAMDTAMANGTASKQLTVTVTCALLKHLGIEADVNEVLEQAEMDAEERQDLADRMQAMMAARTSGGDTVDDGDPGDEDDGENEGGGGRFSRQQPAGAEA